MPPPHYNVFCGCLYASCSVVITSYDADVLRSKLSLYMHTSRPLVEHRMKKEGKGLRSDSPPELKEVGVASISELSSVSTLHIAHTARRTPLDTYFLLHISHITHRTSPDTYFPLHIADTIHRTPPNTYFLPSSYSSLLWTFV